MRFEVLILVTKKMGWDSMWSGYRETVVSSSGQKSKPVGKKVWM
jgi:hypothetical protein